MVKWSESDLAQIRRRQQATREKVDSIPEPPESEQIQKQVTENRRKLSPNWGGKREKPVKPKTSYDPTDTYTGKLSRCHECGVSYGNAKRRYTQKQGGVGFDYFRCNCGYEFSRYC